MITTTLQTRIDTTTKETTGKDELPTTARGRALFTTDWFLNGKPVLRHHDNPRLNLRHGMCC